jgi:hypothetical protein
MAFFRKMLQRLFGWFGPRASQSENFMDPEDADPRASQSEHLMNPEETDPRASQSEHFMDLEEAKWLWYKVTL